MLTRGRLNKYIAKRCHHIRHQVSAFCTTHDLECLHVLRVETKRLRAGLSLLQQCTPVEPPGVKSVKEVYKAAGQIRTAGVNLELLHHLELENAAFSHEQKKIIKEAAAAFCHHAHHYRRKLHKVQSHLVESTCDIKPQKIRELFATRTAQLSTFFSAGALNTTGLHEARKEVKDLLYIQALLPPALAASLGINADYLDQLQHKIGRWHDSVEALALLQSFSAADPTLVRSLEDTAAAQVGEIQAFTTGFDQEIKATAAAPANIHS